MQVVAQLSIQDFPDDVRRPSPGDGEALREPGLAVPGDDPRASSPTDGEVAVSLEAEGTLPPAERRPRRSVSRRWTEPGRWRAPRASTGIPLVRGGR